MVHAQRQNNTKQGFSILELVIAIFVLAVGITGALGLIVASIKNSMDTRNSVIASGLAQEGVELVRNIRDNNMLYALADLSRDREAAFRTHGFPIVNSNCIFDYAFDYTNPVTSCGANIDDPAKLYLGASGNYTHTVTASRTVFRRYVNFSYVNDGDAFLNPNPTGVSIISYVWWESDVRPATCDLANKCVAVEDYLPKRD